MSIFKNGIPLQKIIVAYLPPVLWAALIFTFSSQSILPGFEESVHNFIFKKLAHITVYLVLYLLVVHAVISTISEKRPKTILLLPIFICLIYAISDEFHQSLVPGRYATLRDIGYDSLGIGIAFLKKYGYI
ncbi:VanZ family protein [Candidatus Woesebacteria bacterium]|nr:VanZ family protein [Candidatus Woesebacteria bacterium]